jgi:VanZ family protein
LLMAIIFLASSIPKDGMPSFGGFDLHFKKGGHVLGYLLLAVAYLRGIGRSKPGAFLLAWNMAVLYAVSDEIHQSFVPGRGPWAVDVGIDAAGAFLGLFLARLSPDH